MNSSIPYVGQFSALSLNLDGINTLIPRGAFEVKRCSVVLTYAVATEVSVLGLQEPHVRTDEHLATASSIFVKKGFNLLTNFSPQGNGGAAVAWNTTKWPKLVLSFAIEPRIIMAELANPDGQTIVVLSCHFSHVPSLRKAQWAKLHKARHLFQGKQVLMLADHNSLVVPQRDSDNPPTEDRGDIINARDVELQVLGDMGLSDTWEYVHWGDGTDNDPPPVIRMDTELTNLKVVVRVGLNPGRDSGDWIGFTSQPRYFPPFPHYSRLSWRSLTTRQWLYPSPLPNLSMKRLDGTVRPHSLRMTRPLATLRIS